MEILPDNLWKEISDLVPRKKSRVGRPEVDPRLVISGVLYILKSGAQWRLLPSEFGSPSTIHGKFRKWSRAGIFEKIMQRAKEMYEKNSDNTGYWLAIDTSHSKAPFANWSGRNPTDRGKRGIKRVVIVDHRGAPLVTDIAASNTHDSKLLKSAITRLCRKKLPKPKILAADSAFDARELRKICRAKNLFLTAATNLRRSKATHRYSPKNRWVIERTFGWFSWHRSLKTCWARTSESFFALYCFVAALQLFRMS